MLFRKLLLKLCKAFFDFYFPGVFVEFPDFSDPIAVANGVLECLKTRNLHRLTGFFNEANRHLLHFGKNRRFLVRLSRILEVTARKFSEVPGVAEIREMARDDSWDFQALAGKLNQENDRLNLIALTREGDRYFFDQVSVSHVLEYQKWKLLGTFESL